jgi:hypothetical protein
MKKLIRLHCWETNSSSSHSLSLANGEMEFVYDTIYPDQNGVIRVFGQEFGWGWEKYNDSMTKLAYVFQDSFGQEDLIKEVVMEQTGATDVIFNEGGGYIDHDGVGTTEDLRGNKEEMRNFIFNKNSWLFIGNDNSGPDPTFFHVPEFKDGKQIVPEYKFELVIDGLKETTKYLSYPNEEELGEGIDSLLEYGVLLNEDGHFIMDNSIYWQITRPKKMFWSKDHSLHQDYSKNQILFLKEMDERWVRIKDETRSNPDTKDLRWDDREKFDTEKALQIPGLVKIVKFQLKEL